MGLALGQGLVLGQGGGCGASRSGGPGGRGQTVWQEGACSEASALDACVCAGRLGWASLPAWPCMAWYFVMACGQAWAILEPAAGCDITWAFI
jgi:hypothetical protein